MKTLYLLREDLRTYDNPALNHACSNGEVLPVFIEPEGLGGASKWWLHHSLVALMKSYHELGCPLVLRRGDPVSTVLQLVTEVGADQVVWNRIYSPAGIGLGQELKAALAEAGIPSKSFNGQLLIEPTKVLTQQQTPYKVFTPFWRACRAGLAPAQPIASPAVKPIEDSVSSERLQDWALLPTRPDWSGGLADRWSPGEQGAQERWRTFLGGVINAYKDGRDVPSAQSTSFLSPHLAFGEISVRQIWHETLNAIQEGRVDETNGNKFLSEIGWREFSRYLLVHFPEVIDRPFNPKYEAFPWQDNPDLLAAWQAGKTGYPIVDAGMRELWHTGYMHNRVRMITASFLTKHCLTHWQHGMEWFWDTLVDADIGNNTASWQWAAGCGADAAPYFRIFNPILQSEKFDKQGDYLRAWLPELTQLPNKYIHKPWEAGEDILKAASVKLGEDYPHPVVNHAEARQGALDAYQAFKN